MRHSNKRYIKNSIKQVTSYTIETRDAILWDHLPDQRLCRVKIQGSNTLVVAYYPESWVSIPFWLKPGIPVRIIHRGGLRGRIELVGLGQVIPTPVSGDPFPPFDPGEDTVLTGCQVIQIPNDPQMLVMVKVGTYRIDGVTYILDTIKMSTSPLFYLGMGGAMGEVAEVVEIDAAPPSGYFRIDLIVVGTDGVIDVIKGTDFADDSAEEDVPDVPSGHIELGRILLYAGMTEITNADINRSWVAPEPTSLTVTLSDDDLAWGDLTSTITVAVKDQYDNAIFTTGYGWYITCEITDGNGTITSAEEGSSPTKVGGHTGASSNSYTFTYTRDGLDPGDDSPTFLITLEISFTLTAYAMIILRDAAGAVMT